MKKNKIVKLKVLIIIIIILIFAIITKSAFQKKRAINSSVNVSVQYKDEENQIIPENDISFESNEDKLESSCGNTEENKGGDSGEESESTEENKGGNSGDGDNTDGLEGDENEYISLQKSYVGYYADVDGNGKVDGIIYADLAIGGSGK